MSEAKASSVDPRFDPRYQRGYVPDASAPAAADPAPAASGAAALAPAPAVPAPIAEVDPTPAVAAFAPESSPRATPGAEPEARPEPEPDPGPVFAALIDPDDDSSKTTPWFIAGWGVSVVAAILGISLWWASISSQDYYGGPSDESDRWLQAFGWMVAPTLIEVGLLGVVVMLVWTGIRHARRAGGPS